MRRATVEEVVDSLDVPVVIAYDRSKQRVVMAFNGQWREFFESDFERLRTGFNRLGLGCTASRRTVRLAVNLIAFGNPVDRIENIAPVAA